MGEGWLHRDDESPCPHDIHEGDNYGTYAFAGWFCADGRRVEREDGLDSDDP